MSDGQKDPSARDIYDHADRFLITETQLRKLIDADPKIASVVQFPGMVICAFACELYLKCLLVIEGKKPAKDHNLAKLFGRLEASNKEKIEAEWGRMLVVTGEQIKGFEEKFNVEVPRDLATALADCGNAFEVLRYLYEGKKANFYITHFPQVLRRVIQKLQGWS